MDSIGFDSSFTPSRVSSMKRSAEREMRRRAPKRALGDVSRASDDDGARATSTSTSRRARAAPRFDYVIARSLTVRRDGGVAGVLATCAFNRERSATMDALRMIRARRERRRVDDDGRSLRGDALANVDASEDDDGEEDVEEDDDEFVVAKVPQRGVVFLVRQPRARRTTAIEPTTTTAMTTEATTTETTGVMTTTTETTPATFDAAKRIKRACARARASASAGSRFVEKMYPVSGTFEARDDDGCEIACARVVDDAITRGLTRAKLACAYTRRGRRCEDDEKANAGASEREELLPRVAQAIARACAKRGIDVVVDLKRPNFVVFIEVLCFAGNERVVAVGGLLEDDGVFKVTSARIAPASISALTPKETTPKWMIKKAEREAKELAARRLARVENDVDANEE